MALSVDEIDRWQPEALRSVVHAARLRANVSTTIGDALEKLPAFDNWEGHGAEAARAAIGQTRAHLLAHAQDAMTVARAADTAAEGLSGVKARLYDLRDVAWRAGMQIDPMTSTVLPGPNFRGNAMEAAMQAAQLQPHVDALVADANTIDAELAQAVTGTQGRRQAVQAVDDRIFKQAPTPTPGTPDNPGESGGSPSGADIRRVLGKLPEGDRPWIREVRSPQDLRNLWNWMKQNGIDDPNRYGDPSKGVWKDLPDGSGVGQRYSAGSTGQPALDINLGDEHWKVHINPSSGGVPELPGPIAPGVPEAPARPPASVEAPPVEGLPKIGELPLMGGPAEPFGPRVVPPPHSIHHLPILGEDDLDAPWEYGE